MVLLTGFYITDMSRQMRKTNMEVNPFPLTLLARPTLHGTSRNTLETGGYKKHLKLNSYYRSFPMSSMKLARAFLSTWSEADYPAMLGDQLPGQRHPSRSSDLEGIGSNFPSGNTLLLSNVLGVR